jgi:ATP-binding protein involved in chromosome partitioning
MFLYYESRNSFHTTYTVDELYRSKKCFRTQIIEYLRHGIDGHIGLDEENTTMPTILTEEILDSLKTTIVPSTGKSVVDLGLVSGVIIKEGNVGFSLEIEPAQAKEMEAVRQNCEKQVRAIPGVLSVTVVLTSERPKSSGNKNSPQHQGSQQPPQNANTIPGIAAIVAVASGKGGVGKSTIATNIAISLCKLGYRVGIMDADIYGPSIPRMLGITAKPEADSDKKLLPLKKYDLKCMSMGFLVEEDTPMIWRGPMVQSALEQMLRDVKWGELDFLIVDMPPGTGDAQLTMAQRVPLAGSVIVSTPQDIALLDARKGLGMFRKVNVPVLGFIENMSYFLCPKCGERTEIFSHGGARKWAEKLDVDFLGELPLDMDIRIASDGGTPIAISDPDGPHSITFSDIANSIARKVQKNKTQNLPPVIETLD